MVSPGRNFIQEFQPIFTILVLARQNFTNKFLDQFHGNATAVQSPVHGHRQMDFRSLSPHKTSHFASSKIQCLFPAILWMNSLNSSAVCKIHSFYQTIKFSVISKATGLGWPRIETGGGRLWVRQWTFGFREIAGNFLTNCKPVSCSGRTLHRGVSK
jgi:hypothetical protein